MNRIVPTGPATVPMPDAGPVKAAETGEPSAFAGLLENRLIGAENETRGEGKPLSAEGEGKDEPNFPEGPESAFAFPASVPIPPAVPDTSNAAAVEPSARSSPMPVSLPTAFLPERPAVPPMQNTPPEDGAPPIFVEAAPAEAIAADLPPEAEIRFEIAAEPAARPESRAQIGAKWHSETRQAAAFAAPAPTAAEPAENPEFPSARTLETARAEGHAETPATGANPDDDATAESLGTKRPEEPTRFDRPALNDYVMRRSLEPAVPEPKPEAAVRTELPAETVRDFGEKITVSLDRGDGTYRIRLSPAELGEVTVELKTAGDRVICLFEAENKATRRLLESGVSEIRTLLERSLGRPVTVSPKSEPQNEAGPDPDGNPNPHRQPPDPEQRRRHSGRDFVLLLERLCAS